MRGFRSLPHEKSAVFPVGNTAAGCTGHSQGARGPGVGNDPRGRELVGSGYLAQVSFVISLASFRAAITNWRVWRPAGRGLVEIGVDLSFHYKPYPVVGVRFPRSAAGSPGAGPSTRRYTGSTGGHSGD